MSCGVPTSVSYKWVQTWTILLPYLTLSQRDSQCFDHRQVAGCVVWRTNSNAQEWVQAWSTCCMPDSISQHMTYSALTTGRCPRAAARCKLVERPSLVRASTALPAKHTREVQQLSLHVLPHSCCQVKHACRDVDVSIACRWEWCP